MPDKMIKIETERLLLKSLDHTYNREVLEYLVRNKGFFAPWSPQPQNNFHTTGYQEKLLKEKQKLAEEGKELRFYIFKKDGNAGCIVGDIGFSNIVRGILLSAFLGYKIDGAEASKGYMTEALKVAIEYVFNNLKLHRIEANVMPHNIPSIKLLQKLKFEREGYSRKYLKINGKWEDHLRFALLNERME